MKSKTLNRSWKAWQQQATPEDLDFVDRVYLMAERAKKRGEVIVECYGPKEILIVFKTIEEAADFLGVKAGQSAEIRRA